MPNHVLNCNQLLDAALGGCDYEGFDRSMDMHIYALRRKLDDDPKQPRYIRTVRATGYWPITLSAETQNDLVTLTLSDCGAGVPEEALSK